MSVLLKTHEIVCDNCCSKEQAISDNHALMLKTGIGGGEFLMRVDVYINIESTTDKGYSGHICRKCLVENLQEIFDCEKAALRKYNEIIKEKTIEKTKEA